MPTPLVESLHQKIGVAIAAVDPKEQLRQVMRWYPNKRFYHRESAASNKRILTVYPPEFEGPVFSHEEWYADGWQSPSLDVDLNRPFFSQFAELQKMAPVVGLLSSLQENAEYCQDCEGLKDCYVVFDALDCRDVYYATRIYRSKSCVDVYWIMDSELLYDCVYMFNSYNCRHAFHCSQASDSSFLYDCRNVQHCFMCSGLRNKSYCIRNQQYSKEDYEAAMALIDLSDYQQVLALRKEWHDAIRHSPTPPSILQNCEDVNGNYLRTSALSEYAFESYDLKDAYNVFQCADAVDIIGSFMCNQKVERCFQCCATGITVSNTKNCAFTWHSSNMEYCYLCIGCSDCFGCIGLRNKKYHIFNKPYEKEAYEKKRDALIAAMRARGEYDLFFPESLSPFKEEDTIAHDFFHKDEHDLLDAEMAVASSKWAPDAKQTYTCNVSGELFRLTEKEMEYYTSRGIPLPRIAPRLRHDQRRQLMDAGFAIKEVVAADGTVLQTTFAHPDKWNLVSYQQYQEMIV